MEKQDKEMIKVGTKKISNVGHKHPIEYLYSDVEYDQDGYADASKYLPADFDLVSMKIEGQKPLPGWSHGRSWDGLNLKPGSKIISWKKMQEEKRYE